MSKFKRLLKERGYTTQAFADKTGLSKRTLEAYVSGARTFEQTRFHFALKVADGLEIDPHELLENEEN